MWKILWVVSVFVATACPLAAQPPIIREQGAIYLSDFGNKPLRSPLKSATPAYFGADGKRYAGTLRHPQNVEVQAIKGDMCRVRGIAQQGQILGWIPTSQVEVLTGEFLKNLAAAEERRLTVEGLISRNEVAIGMTLEEVSRSLGKPQRTTHRASSEGTEQIWEYIRYKLVPQQTIVNTVWGPTTTTTFVKVPSGTLEVRCREGLVVALEQTEGTMAGAGQVRIVTPPVFNYW